MSGFCYLVAERTRMICRLRWHLHELDPDWDPRPRSLICRKNLDAYLKARMAAGNTKTEALRALKRRLSDIVYRALLADGTPVPLSQAA